MNEKVYMHGINNYGFKDYNSKIQLKVLSQILKSGALLSLRNQGISSSSNFSGFDYISLCDYEKRDCSIKGVPSNIGIYNSYYQYIICSLSLSFNKDKIEVITPTLVDYIGNSSRPYETMKEYGLKEERYSDLADEVQVKDQVPLEYLEQVTFPTISFLNAHMFFNKSSMIKGLIKEIKKVENLLKGYYYDVPIYDIETKQLMNEENIEKIVRNLKIN